MNRKKIKDIALAVACVMIVINFVGIFSLKQDLKESKAMEQNMQNTLMNAISDIERRVGSGYNAIEQQLKAEQSIFSDTYVAVKPLQGKLEVTARAVPKEIKAGEQLLVKVIADGKTYEGEADANGCAVIRIEPAGNVQVTFILRSDSGVRQESFPEQGTAEALRVHVRSEWAETSAVAEQVKMQLTTWIDGTNDSLPFARTDIEKTEYIMVQSPNGEPKGEQAEKPTEFAIAASDIEGISVVAEEVLGDGEMLGFTADFSEYAVKKDNVMYEIYFSLTLKDGLKYITPFTYNEVASFSVSADGVSQSSGDGDIEPIFQE